MDAKAAVIGLGLTGAVAAGLYLLYRKDQKANKGNNTGADSGTGSGSGSGSGNNGNNGDNNTTPTTPNTNPNSNEGQLQTNKSKLDLSRFKWISNSYGIYYTGLKIYDGTILQKVGGIDSSLYPVFTDPTTLPFVKAQAYSLGDVPYASTLFPNSDIYAYLIFNQNPTKVTNPDAYPLMSANNKPAGYYLPMYWEAINTGNLYISDGSDTYALPCSGISTNDPSISSSQSYNHAPVPSTASMFLQVFYEKLFGLKNRFTNYPIFPFIRANQADELVDWDGDSNHHIIILGPLRTVEKARHTFKKEDIHGYLQNQRQLPIQLKINGSWYTGWFNAGAVHWTARVFHSSQLNNLTKHDGVVTAEAYMLSIAGDFNPNMGNDTKSAFEPKKINLPTVYSYLNTMGFIHEYSTTKFISTFVLTTATPVQGGIDWYNLVYGNKSTSQNTYDPMLYGGMI